MTLDLTTGKYKPYNTPDNITLFINVKSNQPPNIIKNLPENILRRINKLSSDKFIFENSKDLYNSALSNSGFKDKIKFNPDYKRNISKNNRRKRKTIWFNPPYSNNVSTIIGKNFLTILDRHFPKSHKLHKIFNRNNVKISYSSMSNFSSFINSHKKKIINSNIPKQPAPTCNCRLKSSCPLNGNCMQSSLVYICEADTPNVIENHPHYIGLTRNTFKDRFYKHKNSFKYESKRDAAELSNFLWENKHTSTETNLVRNILDKARAYRPETKGCLLRLTEKYHIIFSKLNLLNSTNEFVTKCRHENKFYLVNLKDNIT